MTVVVDHTTANVNIVKDLALILLSHSAIIEVQLGIVSTICLSVCPSQAGTMWRQMHALSRGFDQWVA